MSSAFWICWYNLPESGREDYLSWCHTTYIPQVLARSGVRGAGHYASVDKPSMPREGRITRTTDPNVPNGDRYILIFGGESPAVFVDPTPAEFHAKLSDRDRSMLALRESERSNIMMVECSVVGPEGKDRKDDVAFSPGIQIGSWNAMDYHDEDEQAAWYARSRLPHSMATMPGSVATRKLISVSGWAKHACFYEFTSVEARNKHYIRHEESNPEMAAWSDKVIRRLMHAPGSPNLARRIWPPIG